MKHITSLLIKVVMIAVVLEVVLGLLTNLTFTQILYVSLAVTIVAYLIGDMVVLPMANNNTIATVADIGLSLVTIYLFNYAWTNRHISITDALIAAVVIGVGEWVFHKYVAKNVFPNRE